VNLVHLARCAGRRRKRQVIALVLGGMLTVGVSPCVLVLLPCIRDAQPGNARGYYDESTGYLWSASNRIGVRRYKLYNLANELPHSPSLLELYEFYPCQPGRVPAFLRARMTEAIGEARGEREVLEVIGWGVPLPWYYRSQRISSSAPSRLAAWQSTDGLIDWRAVGLNGGLVTCLPLGIMALAIVQVCCRSVRQQCPWCKYDVQDLSGAICPECGNYLLEQYS
jgi:hypothetical protein